MKFWKKPFILASLLFGTVAFGGPGASGGGKGVVCRSTSGRIRSVETLDLWEARHVYGRKIETSHDSVGAQFELGVDRLKFAIMQSDIVENGKNIPGDEYTKQQLRKAGEPIFMRGPNFTFVQRLRNVTLALTPDSYEVATPAQKGCRIEQIVNYLNVAEGSEPQIIINEDIFEKMTPTEQAALALHEAFYSQLRRSGEADSVRVRRSVGAVYGGVQFPKLSEVLGAEYIRCLGYTDPRTNGLITDFTEIDIVKSITGEIQTVTLSRFGEPAIGFMPTRRVVQNFDEILSGKVCALVPGSVNQIWDTLGGAPIVDFDKENVLEFGCDRTKPNPLSLVYFDSWARMKENPRSVSLTCELVKASKQK